jgi:hypothetical protein
MPRYFFNVYDGYDFFDKVGTECANIKAVQKHLFYLAVDMMENDKPKSERWKVEVLDREGKIVLTMDFGITIPHKLT